MSIELHHIPISETGYLSQIALDFLAQNPNLTPFYPHLNNEAQGLLQIAELKKEFNGRDVLSKSLLKQYQETGLMLNEQDSRSVLDNIDALKDKNTFTVTTGQQIHIMLGPVFVWYKVLSALREAKLAQSQIPGSKVIPVFWMATEDHDLEEIQSIKVFGQEFKWNTEQKGPVGRMHTQGLPEICDQLLERFQNDEEATSFILMCKRAYNSGKTLSQATRLILHELFGQYGLLVLDADCPELKQAFRPVVQKELEEQSGFYATMSKIQELEHAGYPAQINPRELNLFLLGEDRIRLDLNEQGIGRVDSEQRESASFWLKAFDEKPEAFSPNALLRPIYQELILPNLVYVAGGSELAYWMELSSLFDLHNISFPILRLRFHGMMLQQKLFEKLTHQLSIASYFHDDVSFKNALMESKKNEMIDIESKLERIKRDLDLLKQDLEQSSFKAFVGWKDFSQHSKQLESIGKILQHAFDEYFDASPELKSAYNQKQKFFNQEKQERHRPLLEFYPLLCSFPAELWQQQLDQQKFNIMVKC